MRKKLPLHYQILVALALSALLGVVFDENSRVGGVLLVDVLGFFGELFLRSLKMLVIPLILSSLITGMAGVGADAHVGRLGLRTGIYYAVTSLFAVLVGLFLVTLFEPGIIDGKPAREQLGLEAETDDVVRRVQGRTSADLIGVLLRMIPENVLADMAAGEMLSVIVFALLFGYLASKIHEVPHLAVVGFFEGVEQVMLKMTDLVLRFSPLGVLGLVGKVALSTGLASILPLSVFFGTVIVGLVFHALVVLPVLLRFVAKVNPVRHFQVLLPALLMAFSTASSSGTLPVTLEQVEKAGVSRRVASFTLPLGATVNMDGTALYECVAAVFIAQAYGVSLGFGELFLLVLMALLTSVGVAGIPAASLVAISLILTSLGLPLEGIGLILAVDRLLDMCRTTVNVLSDSVAAVVVARLEGEHDLLVTTEPPVAPRA